MENISEGQWLVSGMSEGEIRAPLLLNGGEFLRLEIDNPEFHKLVTFKKNCGDKSPFCGATGALCFGLWLTLPMGFKTRVNAPSPALDVTRT